MYDLTRPAGALLPEQEDHVAGGGGQQLGQQAGQDHHGGALDRPDGHNVSRPFPPVGPGEQKGGRYYQGDELPEQQGHDVRGNGCAIGSFYLQP